MSDPAGFSPAFFCGRSNGRPGRTSMLASTLHRRGSDANHHSPSDDRCPPDHDWMHVLGHRHAWIRQLQPAVPVHEDAVVRGNEDELTDVELAAVEKQRTLNVLLHDEGAALALLRQVRLDRLGRATDLNPSATILAAGLHDPHPFALTLQRRRVASKCV